MKSSKFAYCYRSGQIRIGRRVPTGALEIAAGSERRLRNAVWGSARLAYDNRTWLVPGIPEADSDGAAFDAYERYKIRLLARLAA